MIFSKSFGYAVRSVLYIVSMRDTKSYIQAEEIAATLCIPRHFVSKILKKLVKADVLSSSKGKAGGFRMNETTNLYPLLKLYEIIDGMDTFDTCSLRLQACSADNPCPLHYQMEKVKMELKGTLAGLTIGDLLTDDKGAFIRSIATSSYVPKQSSYGKE